MSPFQVFTPGDETTEVLTAAAAAAGRFLIATGTRARSRARARAGSVVTVGNYLLLYVSHHALYADR